jgi:hypothetical protein
LDNKDRVLSFLLEEIAAITGKQPPLVAGDAHLLGCDAVLNSRELVELLLALEEFAEEKLGVKFDWTSDSALSEARSVFRTLGSLAAHVADLPVAR